MAARLSSFPALAAAMHSSSQQAVLLSTLAAVLHFVGSYWSTQTWHTAAEKAAAAQQLASLGLLPAADAGGSIGGGGGSSSVPAVQQAVSLLLEQLVASDAMWQAHTGVATAAAVATAELAVALARLATAFLPRHQAASVAASLLAPLHSQAAAARFLQAAAAADATLCQPWDAARLAQLLPLARAASAGLQAAVRAAGSGGSAAVPPAGIDTALALLRLLPAGDEPEALQLLSVLLSPRQLAVTAAAAGTALRDAASSKMAQLVGGTADGESSSLPTLPDTARLSQLLLAGYAAPWLAMVPDPDQTGADTAAAGLEPPANIALLRPQGVCAGRAVFSHGSRCWAERCCKLHEPTSSENMLPQPLHSPPCHYRLPPPPASRLDAARAAAAARRGAAGGQPRRRRRGRPAAGAGLGAAAAGQHGAGGAWGCGSHGRAQAAQRRAAAVWGAARAAGAAGGGAWRPGGDWRGGRGGGRSCAVGAPHGPLAGGGTHGPLLCSSSSRPTSAGSSGGSSSRGPRIDDHRNGGRRR